VAGRLPPAWASTTFSRPIAWGQGEGGDAVLAEFFGPREARRNWAKTKLTNMRRRLPQSNTRG
jgi:hypothetical protein